MKLYRTIRLALTVVSTGACVAMPTAARAQTPETTTSSGTIGVIVLAALLVVAVGIAVGLYDRQRRREQKALELQARLSDALLLDPSLPGLTIRPPCRCRSRRAERWWSTSRATCPPPRCVTPPSSSSGEKPPASSSRCASRTASSSIRACTIGTRPDAAPHTGHSALQRPQEGHEVGLLRALSVSAPSRC
jgi:hypothetical protein